MIKKGYKVTSLELTSAIQRGQGCTFYSRENSTRSQMDCGPLTVFKTYAAALRFRSLTAGSEARIFICYYTPSVLRHVWIDKKDLLPLEALYAYNTASIIPDSVDLADELILGEELFG